MDSLDELKDTVSALREKLESPGWADAIGEDIDKELIDIANQFDFLNPKNRLGVKKLHPDAVLPKYNYEEDSGFDLYSVEEVTITPFGRALVPTGLAFEIPEGCEIQVRSKSGLAINQGLMVLNSPGTIDQNYTGEIKVITFNTNNTEFIVQKGMKIAQAVLSPVICGKHVLIGEIQEIKQTDRNDRGFGSTGLI